ncbi:A-kinase anchor protein 9 isoform X2 [Synchiropus splendidus]|uniref:A-kinase anchor protein 9 isoform X2 n=1 Tax=Synchiropus splendidus TaxID=270530 RepID=UPI00237DB22F|nr:A-kinase anchor protein 9 isoform X2 [Synchiropus splendidus]
MEDEERQKKLEAGKAKLAEYRQRKAYADSQKKQKKKKKKKPDEDAQETVDDGQDHSVGREDVSVEGREGSQQVPPATQFTFARTLRSGDTVRHDQTYTIEPESEVSTTAEDYSSEVNGCHEMSESLLMSSEDLSWEEPESLVTGTLQDMEDALAAKTRAVEELSQELEEMRAAFGTEGVQQLQDFEAALKQRDGIITQLTANLQQAREEKDEIMKEFLELTEQSQNLHIQFQQLQAGETLRNSSHSSTAADLFQARQQLAQYQQQFEEMNITLGLKEEKSNEQLELISQLQLQLTEVEMSSRRMEDLLNQRVQEKDLLIDQQEKTIVSQKHTMTELKTEEQSLVKTLMEKNQLISEQTAVISEHERSLSLLREELVHVSKVSDDSAIQQSDEKDKIIADHKRVLSERECSIALLEDELEFSQKRLKEFEQQVAAKELELERCLDELDSSRSSLNDCRSELESYKLELEKKRSEFESCKGELANSRQKERMSSEEVMQLMATVEDLQKRCHQESLSESDAIQKMTEEAEKKNEHLRAELDEMYGQQIVQMKQELHLQHLAALEQIKVEHDTKVQRLMSQNSVEVGNLNANIRDLHDTLEQTKAIHGETSQKLDRVTEEKMHLQNKVESLLEDIHSNQEKLELVSLRLNSQENQQVEFQQLQETIYCLKRELATVKEAAQEEESKHESEITNYKIKLEMLEREKDAVLDRMAESQEAELERLRTQLLFSHEEELTTQREELQREGYLNTENLLNEAAIKHEATLHELRSKYDQQIISLQREKADAATEKDELLHQILDLKEDLKLALHNSKSDELVQQLQELQVELEDLRKEGETRMRIENEMQTLLKKKDLLENQAQEREQWWVNKCQGHELEIAKLLESNSAFKTELSLKVSEIEKLSSERKLIEQNVVELNEEIEKQKITFSVAEKNFKVNCQGLEDEYKCLIETKTKLEETRLKEALELQAQIASLQKQISETEESKREMKTENVAILEKAMTELMEKLNVTLSEKESLTLTLSQVRENLESSKVKMGQLEEDLLKVKQENENFIHLNQTLDSEVKKMKVASMESSKEDEQQQEKPLVCSVKDHHLQIQSLQEKIDALESLLQAAESERDSIKQTLERHRPPPASVSAAAQSSQEAPVEGRSSPQKSAASGSNRRKRRQRSKQERKLGAALSDCNRQREEEEEAALEEERASAAEQEMQSLIKSQVVSHAQEKTGEEDSTDGHQGDGHFTVKQVSGHEIGHRMESVMGQGSMDEQVLSSHEECVLHLQAQRVSLTQIHAAQLELLQEEMETRSSLHELKPGDGDPEEQTRPAASPDSLELQRMRMEAQERQQQMEERHRQEVERLQAQFQQQAVEREERYTTELLKLQQQLQAVTQHGPSGVPEATSPKSGELKHELDDEELSAVGVEFHWPARPADLTAQLQTLRRALYNKYMQEVATLKEQHRQEIVRLAKQVEEERRKRKATDKTVETNQDSDRTSGTEVVLSTSNAEQQSGLDEKQHLQRVEEEVAKAIVQMSVEFAHQTELARINKLACQTTASMQTKSAELDGEETMPENQTLHAWKEVENERLVKELEDRDAQIQMLKEALTKTQPEHNLQKKDGEEYEDDLGVGHTQKESSRKSPLDIEERFCQDSESKLLRANEKLSQVLVEVLKTTAAAEQTMGLHMQTVHDSISKAQKAAASFDITAVKSDPPQDAGQSTESFLGSATTTASFWSREPETDQGLEMSQHLIDNLLLGVEPQLENEEHLMGISGRLQTALEKMLMTITDTTNQLEHARLTQTELMRESFRHNQEINDLLQKQEELQFRLAEEARAREQLALELHRAEGLIDGYTGERAALEEQLRQKEELQLNLEQDLQVTGSRLQELEQERLQMQEERELLSRQQDAMREDAGPRELRLVEAAMVAAPEADLLEETEKLMKEKVEVQRQAEKENTDLLKQMKLLEAELEEQVNRVIELEHAQKTETGDLQQQIQALEKQLEKNRKFLDEQAVDREHERDFFQQEIQKLEHQLKNPQKVQTGSEQKHREVEQLTSQLKEKADWCSELLLSSEQLHRDLGERDEEIEKLESRIRELEQALLASTESLEKVEQKKQHASITEAKQHTLEAQLQTEREALERKEKEICNLEEQLEQFREELENKSEEVQQLHMQLEIQRKEIFSQQQYLETRENMLQVMEEKDRQIALLNEQITKLQHMETSSDNKALDDREEAIKDLESEVQCLRSEQERLKRDNEEELEQLNAVIEKLQQELVNIEQKQAVEVEEEEADETKVEPQDEVVGPSQDEYDEMKQRMDSATKELSNLKSEHCKLLETYLRLKQSAEALAESENPEGANDDIEEALREKTAGLVVMQAQVQALEKSASSRVEELGSRILELEDILAEKENELSRCRLLLVETQNSADGLQQKVSKLEENLKEKMAAVLVSQASLEAFQQQQLSNDDLQSHVDVFNLAIPQMGLNVSQAPTWKVVHLTQKLQELEVGLSGIQKDQELQEQLLSSSEEEVMEYEKRLTVLIDLLSQMTKTQQKTTEGSSADGQPSLSELQQELQEVREEAKVTKDQLEHYKEMCTNLQQELQEKNNIVEKLQEELEMVSSEDKNEAHASHLQNVLMKAQNEASATKEDLNSCNEKLDKLEELLQERQMTIAQIKGEFSEMGAEEEIGDLAMLTQELQQAQSDAESAKEELSIYRQKTENLQEELEVREASISKLKEELEEMKKDVEVTKEKLNSYKLHNETLQESLSERELAITGLNKELQEVRSALIKEPSSPSPSPQPLSSSSSSSSTTQLKKKASKQPPAAKGGSIKDKPSLARKSSATSSLPSDKSHCSAEQQPTSVTHSFTQTEEPDCRTHSNAAKDEVEEVVSEFQEKIVQMQELHAAEILDMEARHISESESLRRDIQTLEDESKALKSVIDKLRSAETPISRQERLASQFKDGYTSDSSSDYSQRTGYELHSLQQELRTTPEGARREPDNPLPDRIKTLLREVHQEGMQVLSLSELPLPEGEMSSQSHFQGWLKERDALLSTVDSLKGLIIQMQTQTLHNEDWRGELLDSVRQVFVRERGVLKSALYSQLDQLDTNDAIIHLNQLEHRLAELDGQHREGMAALHTADRSSLMSEVHHLRAQLASLHQYPQTFSVPSENQRAAEEATDRAVDAERVIVEELKSELSQTKLELETTLKSQHKHLKELETLRSELSQKASVVDELNDQLLEERKRSRDLQWTIEKEKCRTGRSEITEREKMEDLQLEVEEQRNRVAELTSDLERERKTSSQLLHQSEEERLNMRRHFQELQVQLETERAKVQEVTTALGRERDLRVEIAAESSESQPAEERGGTSAEQKGLLERLQIELHDKHSQVVHLLTDLEEQKLEVVRKDEELTLMSHQSNRDKEALLEAKAQLVSLDGRLLEVQEQLVQELERIKSLEEEKERLAEQVSQQEELEGNRALHTESLSQSSDRTKDWVIQQKLGSSPTVGSAVDYSGSHQGPWRTADKILSKLLLVSAKLRGMASKATSRANVDVNSDELLLVQSSVDDVITMLQQSSALPSVPENVSLLAAGSLSSSNTLTERLLRQNAELTGFVSRLTEEKNDLRNHTLRLEEELRRYRQAALISQDSFSTRKSGVKGDSAGLLLTQEREAWAREKSRLEKALQLSHTQLARVKMELRSDTEREITGPEADNVALKRMYGKYLRSESFRKALIYQKKYLLLLLGGFQECEEATLSLLSRMGGRPSVSDPYSQHRRGLMRFRSAVRVSIALSRMRFLVKRWHRATGMSSSSPDHKHGSPALTGNEGRDSHYLHPSSVEVFRERGRSGGGGGSSRRSGRESPRSGVSPTHHRFHSSGDPGALTCSHLQSYDPDRALTDYISRLEALQRRLGSVTSGASSYAHLHFGLRR